ncbi:MAG: type II toxin-antitoxin system RelE/ParE family toxin [bacterium]
MRIRWSEPARDDVLALREYIARDSPFYARRFTERLVESAEILGDLPRIGGRVPEADRDDVRELIFHAYRIIYFRGRASHDSDHRARQS